MTRSLIAVGALLVLLGVPSLVTAQSPPADPAPYSSVDGLYVGIDGPSRQHVGGGLRLLLSTNQSGQTVIGGRFDGSLATRCPKARFKFYVSSPQGRSTQRVVDALPAQALTCVRRHLPKRGVRLLIDAVYEPKSGDVIGDSKNNVTMLP